MTEAVIRELIADGNEIKFYKSKEWNELRAYIMEKYHNECQECVKRGKVTIAKVVHHVNELKKRPDLALSEFYTDCNGETKSNLLPLCQDCHNAEHDRIDMQKPKKQLNVERW